MTVTQYEYRVRVDHFITFTDDDVRADLGNGKHAEVTDEDRERFAQYAVGGDQETEFDFITVEEYDTSELEDE